MDLIKERYEEERTKRLCSNGNAQYIETSKLVEFEQFMIDHWVDSASVKLISTKFPGNQIEMLIVGAGWGGIKFAIRMI
jgi:hypothetical protein